MPKSAWKPHMRVTHRTGKRRGQAPASKWNLRCQSWIGFLCKCGTIVNVRAAHKVAKLRARKEGTSPDLVTILDKEGCGLCATGLKPNYILKIQHRQHNWITKIQTQEAILIAKPNAINDEHWCVLGGENIDSAIKKVTDTW